MVFTTNWTICFFLGCLNQFAIRENPIRIPNSIQLEIYVAGHSNAFKLVPMHNWIFFYALSKADEY